MSMNDTPSGERIHIGFFGKRNAGKSSLINAITGQELSIVSDVKGTTTDPVKKAMELLPLGPVVLIDTPGLDDEGALGQMRIEKSYQMLRQSDIVILVLEAFDQEISLENEFLKECKKQGRKVLLVINKIDLDSECNVDNYRKILTERFQISEKDIAMVSAGKAIGIQELKETIGRLIPTDEDKPLIRDLLKPGDVVVLVVPIDESAPKGRLILPQQQVIRDILEADAIPIVTKETRLNDALLALKEPPRMVVTDSQVFGYVSKVLPKEIPLTSFSVLMARYKGNLKIQVKGAQELEGLKDGDRILICEGCTHHRQCGDIGTVKIPAWMEKYTGKKLEYSFTSGGEFPSDISTYSLVVHCGGCTLNPQEMRYRINQGEVQAIPITNYGVMIAYIHGILPRVIEPFCQELES